MTGEHDHSVIRLSLPDELVDQLNREATRRGVAVEVLVDELMVEHLPEVLADAARTVLRRGSGTSGRMPTGLRQPRHAEAEQCTSERTDMEGPDGALEV